MAKFELHITNFYDVLKNQRHSSDNAFTIILDNGIIINAKPRYDFLNKYSVGLSKAMVSDFSPFKDYIDEYTNYFIVDISEILYIITYADNSEDSLYKIEHHLLSTFDLHFIKEEEISNFSVFYYINEDNNTINEYEFNQIYKIPSEEELDELNNEMEFIYGCVRECRAFKTLTDAVRYRNYLDYLNNGKLYAYIDYLNQNS